MHLYRPVGMKELGLIYLSGMKQFPPRLPEQPIFYPVLNFEYASQIANDWNTQSGDFAGYVTEFDIDDAYSTKFDPHIVGSKIHKEWWVPAEQLDEFNKHIIDLITVTAAYFGKQFVGHIAERFNLKGRNTVEQFCLLSEILEYNGVDFIGEVNANALSVFLNCAYWTGYDFTDQNITMERKKKGLAAVDVTWDRMSGGINLPMRSM